MLKRIIGCSLVVVAILSIARYIESEKEIDKARIAERNSRCAEQIRTPPKPFESDFDCIGWRQPSDIPIPAAG